MRIERVNKKYCVYGHYVDGTCIYIGSGRLARAFNVFQAGRNETWKARIKTANVDIEIFLFTDNRQEALKLERVMIRVMQPECNITGIINSKTGTQFERSEQPYKLDFRPIKCVQTGKYYKGTADAGRDMNIHQARISAVVHGRCSSADGYTFVRVSWDEAGMEPRRRPLPPYLRP